MNKMIDEQIEVAQSKNDRQACTFHISHIGTATARGEIIRDELINYYYRKEISV